MNAEIKAKLNDDLIVKVNGNYVRNLAYDESVSTLCGLAPMACRCAARPSTISSRARSRTARRTSTAIPARRRSPAARPRSCKAARTPGWCAPWSAMKNPRVRRVEHLGRVQVYRTGCAARWLYRERLPPRRHERQGLFRHR
ncbi:hypothetical protein [Hankyongella ginsenosidimutans]|uniref:hypothetical protein n=1 Tax=Hankyongella ginsenosidimutans TaxID=1763828 RepID=UPI003CCC8B69